MFPATKPHSFSAATVTSNVDNESEDLAATMKVCRVCLAMNVKMYHISEHNLCEIYKQVTGVEITPEDKLPQMLCWECVARLTTANNFRETALNIHWILLAKIVDDKCITMSDIESIDRAQYQFESTLGFKYYEANNTDLHIQGESDGYDFIKANEEVNTDSHHEIEQIYVSTNNEKVTIKSECLDETEQQQEADFQIPNTVITKKEILSDEEMSCDIEVKLEDILRDDYEASTSLRNQRSEERDCKELRVDLEDTMFNSNKHNTQDPLTQFTADSSLDTGIAHHPQIKQEIFEEGNHFMEKITIDVPSISTGIVDSDISLLQKHTTYSKNMFICDICDKQFKVKGTLTRHLKKHPKVHYCTYCSYKVCHRNDLRRHINRVHTKNLTLNCSFCGYKAYDKSTLTRHVNVKHTKKNVYNCSLCSYKAYDKSTLTKHVNVKHTKNKVYNCTFCIYTTYEKRYLTTHVNSKHTKTNVYNCTYCSYTTYHQSDLSKHTNAQHTKKNSYDCSYCDYKTYHRSHLTNHINVKHTKNVSYVCTLCNYKTYHRSALYKHIKAKHTNK